MDKDAAKAATGAAVIAGVAVCALGGGAWILTKLPLWVSLTTVAVVFLGAIWCIEYRFETRKRRDHRR